MIDISDNMADKWRQGDGKRLFEFERSHCWPPAWPAAVSAQSFLHNYEFQYCTIEFEFF